MNVPRVVVEPKVRCTEVSAAPNSPLQSPCLHVSRCRSSKALPYRLSIVDWSRAGV
jgi:hypothetical protein